MPGPLADFFARYPHFNYRPAKSATAEFYRLCDSNGWDRNDEEKKVAKEGFQDALTMQFNDNYGSDVNDIARWQALCAKLQMDPVPKNLKDCREAVRNTYVNLVDLVDNFASQETVRMFPTEFDLSEYTKQSGKFFPRDNAHAGNLLKFLLRQIMNPRSEHPRNAHGRGRIGGRRGRGRGRA